MIYQVLNRHGQPASTDTNPDAIFTSTEDAESYIAYLKNECDLNDEIFIVEPFGTVIKNTESLKADNVWTFVERFIPKYYSSDLVAESNDLDMIIDGEWVNSDAATNYRNDLIEEFKENNGVEPEDFQIVERAQELLNQINATIYEEAIEGFLNELKGE